MKFRKKPVIIEAVRWKGNNIGDIKELSDNRHVTLSAHTTSIIEIETLEGNMKASIGDWIIKGVKGEIYPCKPDIFEKTYEKIGDQ